MTEHGSIRKRVRVWLAHEEKNQEWLANELGIHPSQLSRVLAGYDKSERVIAALRDLTGIDASSVEAEAHS